MEQGINDENKSLATSVDAVYDLSTNAEGSSPLEDLHSKPSTNAATHAATSVFDELDSGVGARVGKKIGAALKFGHEWWAAGALDARTFRKLLHLQTNIFRSAKTYQNTVELMRLMMMCIASQSWCGSW